jgi:glycosyltransferase involved in cell wall biosynthesis
MAINKIKVSIITVNLNDVRGLKSTLESVAAQTQTEGWEQIVIDGGSTDGSRELMEQYASQLAYAVSEPDGGIYQGMNKGVTVARGEYCLFLNSADTLASPTIMAEVLPLLTGESDYYVGNMLRMGKKCSLVTSPKMLTAAYLAQRSLPHQAMFIRTSLLKRRLYQAQYRIVADWEQQVWELVLHNASYRHLDIIISHFNADGVSNTQQEKSMKERLLIRDTLFNQCLLASLEGRNKYEKRLFYLVARYTGWRLHLKLVILHLRWMLGC